MQLGPSDHEISERHKKELAEAKAYARKMTVVTLGGDKDKDKDKDDKDVKMDMVSISRVYAYIPQHCFVRRKWCCRSRSRVFLSVGGNCLLYCETLMKLFFVKLLCFPEEIVLLC